MVYIKPRTSTLKQMAYARRVFGAQGENRKQIALDVGYSPYVANSVKDHIENKPGFNNAMALLAVDSNNLALAAMAEFKARGFKDFSNKDLVGALNAIGQAWSKFNGTYTRGGDGGGGKDDRNRLRTVILQQIENQTLSVEAAPETPEEVLNTEEEDVLVVDNEDF